MKFYFDTEECADCAHEYADDAPACIECADKADVDDYTGNWTPSPSFIKKWRLVNEMLEKMIVGKDDCCARAVREGDSEGSI